MVEADITGVKVDAVVNPANSLMIMGGGVAGALKRAGGSVIEEEAMRHAPVPVGEAVVTTAGKLPSRAVIHAPTMERPAMRIPIDNVIRAARAALKAAAEKDFESIALPALGAGVGGLPVDEVAKSMAEVVASFEPRRPSMVLFVARSSDAYNLMLKGVREALGSEGSGCPEELRRLV